MHARASRSARHEPLGKLPDNALAETFQRLKGEWIGGADIRRDPRSRWGSCTSEGGLMFSWRLVMAPPEVLDYVAAHEVAHLAEMNHSPAFWALVEQLCPHWRAPRNWLRDKGHALHGYRFESPPPPGQSAP